MASGARTVRTVPSATWATKSWAKKLHTSPYETHSMRRTKASLIYRRTKNIRAVQILLGHTKLEGTVRYLGIEVEDALEMAEPTEA
jgi:integrase